MSLLALHIHLNLGSCSGASNHIFDNKDLFFALIFTSSLPVITSANGTETIAKAISSTHPVPSLPLIPSFMFSIPLLILFPICCIF